MNNDALENIYACANEEQLEGAILFDALKKQLLFLLKNDMEKLMQALYRIDIQEIKVKKAFQAPTLEQIAQQLAICVIERTKQKISTRNQYKDSF